MSPEFRLARKILCTDWDPTGWGVPVEDYDNDAPAVTRLLIERKPRERGADYVCVAAADTTGRPVSDEKLSEVVAQRMALRDDGGTQS